MGKIMNMMSVNEIIKMVVLGKKTKIPAHCQQQKWKANPSHENYQMVCNHYTISLSKGEAMRYIITHNQKESQLSEEDWRYLHNA